MTEKQKFLLQMLDEIHEICSKNNIQYSLAGGTLIGAVRNKGFLPWDDDADIYMIRSEFERFEEACRTQIPENRILQTPLDLSYTNTFPRYTSTDTTAIHSHQSLNDEFVGEVIDIFILDPIRADEETIRRYTYNLMLYSDLLNYSGVFGRRFGVSAEDFRKYRKLEEKKGTLYIRNLFEEKLSACLSDDGDTYIMRWGGNPMLRRKSWFDPIRTIEFEGRNYLCISGIDEYLTGHYGDEWYLVPHVKEQSSHDVACSAVITPDEARKICLVKKRNKIKKDLRRRKIGLLKDAEEDYEIQNRRLRFEASVITEDTMRRFEQWGGAVSEIFVPSEIPVFEKIFGYYAAWQFSAEIAGRDNWNGVRRYNDPLTGDLSPEAVHALVRYLFHTEKVGRAARYIQILEYHGKADAYTASFADAIRQIRLARADLQYKNVHSACMRMKDVFRRFPGSISVLKVSIDALLRYETQEGKAFAADGEADGFSAYRLIQAAQTLYPQDGDFVYYALRYDQIRAVTVSADAEVLPERLSFILSHSRNGWIMRHVAEMAKDAQLPELFEAAQTILAGREAAETSAGISDFDREVCTVYENLQIQIAKICEQADVTPLLNPLQLQAVEKNEPYFRSGQNAYVLYVSGRDMLRMVTWLEQHSGILPDYLEYEYMGNNRAYPDLTVRFYDTRTTSLEKTRCYHHTGMFVSVQVLKPDRFPLFIRYQMVLWRRSCFTDGTDQAYRKMLLHIHDRQKKKLFVRVMKSCMKPGVYLRIELNDARIVYDARLFEQIRWIEKDGVRFAAPQNTEQYLKPAEEAEEASSSPGKSRICSPRYSLSEEEASAYRTLLERQSVRRRSQKWQKRIRRELDDAFAMQKAAIAAEEEKRLSVQMHP